MARELVAPGLGSFHKWDKIGSKLKGQYVGQGASKFGAVIIINQEDGIQKKASMPGDLGDWMTQVQPGEYVEITFVEAIPGKQPQPFKKFLVVLVDAPSAGQSVAGSSAPSVADIEAAKALLLANVKLVAPQAQAGEYDHLLKLLSDSNPKGAAAIKGALEAMYPEAERLGKLKETLVQQGIKVDG